MVQDLHTVSFVLSHTVSANFQSYLGSTFPLTPAPSSRGSASYMCHKHRFCCHSLHPILHSSSCIPFGPINSFPQTCDGLCHEESWLRTQSFSDMVWWLLPLSGNDNNNNIHLIRFCETEISQCL